LLIVLHRRPSGQINPASSVESLEASPRFARLYTGRDLSKISRHRSGLPESITLLLHESSEAVFPACRLVTPGRDPLEARPRSCPFGVLLAVVGVVLGRALPRLVLPSNTASLDVGISN